MCREMKASGMAVIASILLGFLGISVLGLEGPQLYIYSDFGVYRLGSLVVFRVLAVDVGGAPAGGVRVLASVYSPAGTLVSQFEGVTDTNGMFIFEVQFGEEGVYTVSVEDIDLVYGAGETTVLVCSDCTQQIPTTTVTSTVTSTVPNATITTTLRDTLTSWLSTTRTEYRTSATTATVTTSLVVTETQTHFRTFLETSVMTLFSLQTLATTFTRSLISTLGGRVITVVVTAELTTVVPGVVETVTRTITEPGELAPATTVLVLAIPLALFFLILYAIVGRRRPVYST
ncbi:MAG: hypothetical protein QXH35_06260 [Nitrososphaerota archaeon]